MSPKGRLNRLTYFANSAGINIAAFALLMIVGAFADSLFNDLTAPAGIALTIGVILIYSLLNYLWFCLVAKRLHDLGLSAWLGLVLFIDYGPWLLSMTIGLFDLLPLAFYEFYESLSQVTTWFNLAAGLCLLLIPGKKGDNRYGPDPLAYLRPSKPHVLEG
nr:DUF805 domain-containing protein [Asticcacaulis aquaticus]